MKFNKLRRTFFLKTMVASAAVVFPSILLADKLNREKNEENSTEAIIHTVVINQFKFEPAIVNIKIGDTIKWINKDIVPHTATASDGSWDTGEIKTNQSKSLIFNKDAIVSYYCFYHPMMKAQFKLLVTN